MAEKTFVKITNREIYNTLNEFKDQNAKSHTIIIQKLGRTNGKVKLGFWIASTGLSLTLILLGFLFNHISK